MAPFIRNVQNRQIYKAVAEGAGVWERMKTQASLHSNENVLRLTVIVSTKL